MSETPGKARHLTSRLSNRLCGDRELARRVSGGDSAAFDEVFRRYHQPIYRFCSAMVGAEEAKDVLQNVMTKAVTSMPDDKDFQMKPWLYRVARNECVDQIRSARRSERGLEADAIPDRSGSREPHRVAESRERLSQLVEDLNELPENQRAALVMRELSGLGYAEIAGSVGTSEAGAKQMVYEARLALEQMDLGRSLDCADVRRTISAMDRRRLRGKKVRSHLRSCDGCRDFERSIGVREAGFRSFCPVLPLGLATGILGAIRDGGSTVGMAGGGAAGVSAGGIAAGGLVSTGAVSKGLLAVVVAGGIGVGSAELVKHRDSARSGSDPVSRTLDTRPADGSGIVGASGRIGASDAVSGAERATRGGDREGDRTDASGRAWATSRSHDSRVAVGGSTDGRGVTPGQGNGTGPSASAAASDKGQARAAEASSAKPGRTGSPPPSQKPPAPPGQSGESGSSTGSSAAGGQGAGGGGGAARAVGKPESPGKSGK